MAKNDYIKVTYSTPVGVGYIEVRASQNGRTVEEERSTKDLTISELTRGGTLVQSVWFPMSNVISIETSKKADV